MKEVVLLSRLLDKYENSKHLREPGVSTKQVALRVEKKELSEYNYEDARIRDEWNAMIKELEAKELISAQWVKGEPVLSAVFLNLDHISESYHIIGRKHPKELAQMVEKTVSESLSSATTDWIIAWRDDICKKAKEDIRIPDFCKKNLPLLEKLLTAMVEYDRLNGNVITVRTFSVRCYQNTKTFEQEIKPIFLRIALKYSTKLEEAYEQGAENTRDQLAFLGIYARPELYEFCGPCIIQTKMGILDTTAMSQFGIALPSTAIDSILTFDLSKVSRIIFIENKTNYDEFVLSELKADELAVYHGGFFGPQKQKFFEKLAESTNESLSVSFWADIDLGGFRMFERLQTIFPQLTPFRMSSEDVSRYHSNGLKRNEKYLKMVRDSLMSGDYPLFHPAMIKILEYGVTIEQEVFLTKTPLIPRL